MKFFFGGQVVPAASTLPKPEPLPEATGAMVHSSCSSEETLQTKDCLRYLPFRSVSNCVFSTNFKTHVSYSEFGVAEQFYRPTERSQPKQSGNKAEELTGWLVAKSH